MCCSTERFFFFFFNNCLCGNSARGRRKSDITYQAGVEPQVSKCAEMRKETVCAHRQTLWNSGNGYLLSSAPSTRFYVGCGASIPTWRSYLVAASIVLVVSSSSVLFSFRVCGDIVSSWCSTNVSWLVAYTFYLPNRACRVSDEQAKFREEGVLSSFSGPG